jgi:hypothetical protein
MAIDEQETVDRARRDLAQRLGVSEAEVVTLSVKPADFPDAALGAPVEDEMSAQVISPGLRIKLKAINGTFEYRANERQLRLVNFNGENYRI